MKYNGIYKFFKITEQMRIFYSFIVILILSAVLLVQDADAQLTGVKTVKAAGGTYSTLSAAITDLNTNGVGAGGVTFNVEAGFTESTTAPLIITTTGTSLNTITFQKDPATSGLNPKITRTDAGLKTTSSLGGDGDAIIQINGSDYLTINGIDVQSDQSTIEYGYYTYKPSGTDGCQNVVIKNSAVTMIKSTVTIVVIGIYISNGPTSVSSSAGVTVTNYSGRNENIEVSNNSIQNVNHGIYALGYNHTASPFDFYDQNITIGKVGAGNTIQNFQWTGTTGSVYGIYSAYSNNFNASYNNLNNTAGGGAASTSWVYAIFSSYTKAANITYSYNTLSLTSTGTRLIQAFGNNAGDSNTTLNVHHNIVENCVHGSSSTFNAFNNGVASVTVNLYANTVRNNTINTSASIMFNLGSVDTANVYDNIVENNTIAGGTGTNTAINISSGIVNVYGNSISGYNATAAAPVYAISISGGTSVKVYNNLIYDIKTIYSHATTDAIRGISITSATANSNIGVYYNTIYLDALTGGAEFGTSCIFHTYNATSTTAALDMRDNILVNVCTPGGAGKTSSFRRSAATNLNNYSTLSNCNLLYAGIPGASNLIYYDGTNSYQTLAEFKTATGPVRDTGSVTEFPPFVNIVTTPYNLHINPAIPTYCESRGSNVATITNDFAGVIRQGNPGYTGTGTAPDLGVYEGEYTPFTITVINSQTGTQIVKEYRLEQNFPNPFNPTTSIKYSILKSGLVILRVYNVSGKEVSTLINEVKNKGTYSVDFNATNLSSGIYFYELTSGNFVQTKRMMLIK